MLVAETYLGSRDDPAVADRLANGDAHRVVLSETDRRRSRVRTTTVDGADLGIVVARDLEDGDVLETGDGDLVAVELAAVDALVLDITGVSATAAVELGHALGNRHWDLALRNDEALVPVPDTRDRMASAVADLLPAGVTTRFEAVPPTTFDDDHAPGDHSHAHDDHRHDGGPGDPEADGHDGGPGDPEADGHDGEGDEG